MSQTLLRSVMVGLAVFLLPFIASGEPEHGQQSEEMDSQVGIMAKVIERSLDEADLEGWKGLAGQIRAFGSTVEGQYIPTVGAIFTVPVAFLITEPPNQPAPTAPSVEEPDLWEKFQKKPRKGAASPSHGAEPQPKRLDGLEDRVRTDELFVPGPEASGLEEKSPMVDREVADAFFDLIPGIGGGPLTYNKERVKTLRETVVSTVARYGHRLTGIPDAERVIVIVEAPKASGLNTETDNGVARSFSWFGGRVTGRDRLFLGFKKSLLSGETSAETINSEVQVIAY